MKKQFRNPKSIKDILSRKTMVRHLRAPVRFPNSSVDRSSLRAHRYDFLTFFKDRSSLREWWHDILRNHGRYSCYAMILTLPADEETMNYLTDFGKELDLISGSNCLIIALSKTEFIHINSDEDVWIQSVEEQISEGYSLAIARLFDIDLTEFPCLVIFRDIRSPEHIVVALEGMTTEEIAEKMRTVFSTIEAAARSETDPLEALEKQRKQDELHEAGQAIGSNIRSLAGKTLQTAIEALIKANIPGP